MRKLLIVILLVTAGVELSAQNFDWFSYKKKKHSAYYTPVFGADTTFPFITPYTNGYIRTNGTGAHMRMNVNPPSRLIWSVTDSFQIKGRMAIMQWAKSQILYGLAWIAYDYLLTFHYNAGNTVEFFQPTASFTTVKNLGATTDTSWFTYELFFRKKDSTLKVYYNDALQTTRTAYIYGNNADASAILAIGNFVEPCWSGLGCGVANPTGWSNAKYDRLEMHKWYQGTDSLNSVWEFNEGAGQYAYNTNKASDWDRNWLIYGAASNHLLSGVLSAPDSQDVAWYVDGTTKSGYQNIVTALNTTGLQNWASGNYAEVFGLGGTIWRDSLTWCGTINRGNTTLPPYVTQTGDSMQSVGIWNTSLNKFRKIGSNGSVFNTNAYQVFEWGDTLMLGGAFTDAGSANGDYIVQFKTTTTLWDTLAKGVNNEVYCFGLDNDDMLLVGGNFTQTGATPLTYIGKWNGISWSSKGDPTSPVWDIEWYNNELYIGTSAGLMKWNGSSWAAVGSVSGVVYQLAVYRGELWLGGGFTVGSTSGIAKYNGSAITAINGIGLTGFESGKAVTTMKVHPNGRDLYIAGTFYRVDGVACNKLARWNGRQWSPVVYGVDQRPEEIVFNTESGNVYLYLIGDNYTANGKTAYAICKINVPD